MKTIILVGIPGCGKSSILKETVRKVPFVAVANYGDKMLEEAATSGFSRDQLRKLPIEEQREIGIRAAHRIMQEKKEITIVDTHALIRTPTGYIPGLPKEVLDILSPRVFTWIECSPQIVKLRRAADSLRVRDEESIGELSLHQELSRAYLAACSVATGATLCSVNNNGPSIEENAAPLVQLIRSFGQ